MAVFSVNKVQLHVALGFSHVEIQLYFSEKWADCGQDV